MFYNVCKDSMESSAKYGFACIFINRKDGTLYIWMKEW